MSNFNCAKCGAAWIDESWLGYKTECKHTMEEAMTPATPRTDALHFDWKDGIDMQRHELLKLSRALERELAAIHEEAETNPKWAFLEWRKRAEEAKAEYADLFKRLGQAHAALEQETNAHEDADREVMALLAALEEIRDRAQFGVSTHMSSDVVKLCDAALKEGK